MLSRDNNSYADNTISGYRYGDVFVEKTTVSEKLTCNSFANCYIGCSCNTGNGWYSTCSAAGGTDCKSVTDTRYVGVNSMSASGTGSVSALSAGVSTQSANGNTQIVSLDGGVSTMSSGATTCYKKKTCEEGGYYSAIPDGLTCDPVKYNDYTCYENCVDNCGDGNAYYTMKLSNLDFGTGWNPDVSLDWDSNTSDPCVIDGTKGSMEVQLSIWCPADCQSSSSGDGYDAGSASVDIELSHPGDYAVVSNSDTWCPSGSSSPSVSLSGCYIDTASCNSMNQDCKNVSVTGNTSFVAETKQGAKFHYTLDTSSQSNAKCEDGGYLSLKPYGKNCDTIRYLGLNCYTNCRDTGTYTDVTISISCHPDDSTMVRWEITPTPDGNGASSPSSGTEFCDESNYYTVYLSYLKLPQDGTEYTFEYSCNAGGGTETFSANANNIDISGSCDW